MSTRLRQPIDRDALVVVYFLALGVAAFLPTLDGGLLLQLDMIFAPDTSYLAYLFEAKGPLYYGRLPFVALLDVVTAVVPDWVVQRAILVGGVAGAGWAAYSVTDDLDRTGRLFAGTLYAVNPVTYVRLLAGQWYFVLGYAALPLAVVSFYGYVAGERPRPTRAVLWTTVVAVFDPHAAVLLLVAGVSMVIALGVVDRARTIRRTARFCGLAVLLNAFWLVPALAVVSTGDSQLGAVTGADLRVFSPDGVVSGNVGLSVAMLYAFWRGGYTYAFEILGVPATVAIAFVVVVLVVSGWLVRDDAFGHGVALTAVVGGVLTVGVATQLTAPLYRALATTPLGAGMRESGKFVGLLVLGYSILGGCGVSAIRGSVSRRLEGWLAADRPALTRVGPLWKRMNVTRTVPLVVLSVCLVALPLVYAVPMVPGFGGAFEPTEYPDEWHAADERFADAEGRILVLPWHQYVRFEWTGRTVANPASMFFGPRTIASRTPGIGIGSQATDPAHRRVRALLAADDHERFGHAVARLGVEYVVVMRTAGHERFSYLREQTDLTVVSEGQYLVVYHNEAFDEAPPPAEWPRDSPRVPDGALVAGSLLSLVGVGYLVTRETDWFGKTT